MKIVWQDKAESDLDRIAEHIMEDDPAAELRVVSIIFAGCSPSQNKS